MCGALGKAKRFKGAAGAEFKERSSAPYFHGAVAQRRGRGAPTVSTYVSGGAACLGAALHPGLRKPAASLARGLGKSLPRPTRSAWQRRIPAAAAGSECAEGSRGWRRLAGARRGERVRSLWDAASPPVSAILGRGARPLSLSEPLASRAVSRALCNTTSQLRCLPFRAGGDRRLTRGRRGGGERTFRPRCSRAEARDASISRWCCGPRHLSQSRLSVPGS